MTKARDLANIISGGFTESDIPNLSASKITSGTLDNARITLDANEIPNISTDKLTSGTIPDARLPSTALNSNVDLTTLSASNLTSGTVATARLGTGTANATTFLRGDNTFAEAGGGEWTKLSHVTANNDATVVFNSSLITSTYQDYKVVYSNIHSASDRQTFELRVSVDNGSNITNTDYVNRLYKPDGHVSSRGVTDSAEFQLHGNETSGNATGESLSGFIEIFDPSATDTRKHILGRTVFNLGDSGIVHSHSVLGASTRVTNAVNYLRFNWASGNIASGEFTLYGRKI